MVATSSASSPTCTRAVGSPALLVNRKPRPSGRGSVRGECECFRPILSNLNITTHGDHLEVEKSLAHLSRIAAPKSVTGERTRGVCCNGATPLTWRTNKALVLFSSLKAGARFPFICRRGHEPIDRAAISLYAAIWPRPQLWWNLFESTTYFCRSGRRCSN